MQDLILFLLFYSACSTGLCFGIGKISLSERKELRRKVIEQEKQIQEKSDRIKVLNDELAFYIETFGRVASSMTPEQHKKHYDPKKATNPKRS